MLAIIFAGLAGRSAADKALTLRGGLLVAPSGIA